MPRNALPPVLLFVFVIFVFMLPVFKSPDLIPFGYTDFAHIMGIWKHTREALAQGIVPTWTTQVVAGYPWIHNTGATLMYPLNWPLLLFGPWPSFVTLIYALHLFIACLGVYAFLRLLSLSRAIACAGAIGLVFGRTYFIRIVSGEPTYLSGLAWIPWFFWAFEAAIQRRSFGLFALAGAITAMPILCGMPEQAVFIGHLALPYLIFRLRMEADLSGKWKFGFKASILYLVSATLMALPQALPLLTLFFDGPRQSAGLITENIQNAFPPYYLFLYFFPDVFGNPLDHTYWGIVSSIWGPYPYIGVALSIAAVWYVFHKDPDTGMYKPFFVGMFITVFLLVMGGHSPVFRWAQKIDPFFVMFRGPWKLIHLLDFSVLVLGALGLEQMTRRVSNSIHLISSDQVKKAVLAGMVLLALASVAAAVFSNPLEQAATGYAKKIVNYIYYEAHRGRSRPVEEYYARIPKVYKSVGSAFCKSSALILIFVTLMAAARKISLKVPVPYCVLCFSLVDLWLVNATYVRPGNLKDYAPESMLVRHIQETIGLDRVNGFTGPWSRVAQYWYGVPNAGGAVSIDTFEYPKFVVRFEKGRSIHQIGGVNYFTNFEHPFYNLLGIRYVLTETPIQSPSHRLVMVDENAPVHRQVDYMDRLFVQKAKVYLYENTRRFPRMFLATSVYVSPPDKVLDRMEDLGESLRSVAVISDTVPAAAWPAGSFTYRAVEYRYQRASFEVSSDSGGFLVLTDQMRPGWRAEMDGRRVPLIKTDYLFRGLVLPPGNHRVTFKYRPPEVYAGVAAGVLGVFWTGGWLMADRRDRKRKERQND